LKKSCFSVVAGIAVLAFAGWAMGYSTPINPAPSGELDLLSILNKLYGLANVQRIEDGPFPGDQIWLNLDGGATATAKYSAYDQTFGYIPGESGGTFVPLFTATGGLYPIHGSGVGGTIPGGVSVFRFGDDPSGAPLRSSRESDNTSGNDHMVTWLITGGQSAGNYAIAWEDLDLGDADYNDLVVEVSGVSPVPEASTLILFGAGLSGLLFYAKKRRLIKL